MKSALKAAKINHISRGLKNTNELYDFYYSYYKDFANKYRKNRINIIRKNILIDY